MRNTLRQHKGNENFILFGFWMFLVPKMSGVACPHMPYITRGVHF